MEHRYLLSVQKLNKMFCRIYVSGEGIERRGLTVAVCDLLGAQLVSEKYIEKDGYSIEVRPNDEYDKMSEREFPDGFLYFPLSIEIDIQDGISKEDAAREVGGILEFLWEGNYAAIASCEFEDLLPEKGGYNNRNVPWAE